MLSWMAIGVITWFCFRRLTWGKIGGMFTLALLGVLSLERTTSAVVPAITSAQMDRYAMAPGTQEPKPWSMTTPYLPGLAVARDGWSYLGWNPVGGLSGPAMTFQKFDGYMLCRFWARHSTATTMSETGTVVVAPPGTWNFYSTADGPATPVEWPARWSNGFPNNPGSTTAQFDCVITVKLSAVPEKWSYEIEIIRVENGPQQWVGKKWVFAGVYTVHRTGPVGAQVSYLVETYMAMFVMMDRWEDTSLLAPRQQYYVPPRKYVPNSTRFDGELQIIHWEEAFILPPTSQPATSQPTTNPTTVPSSMPTTRQTIADVLRPKDATIDVTQDAEGRDVYKFKLGGEEVNEVEDALRETGLQQGVPEGKRDLNWVLMFPSEDVLPSEVAEKLQELGEEHFSIGKAWEDTLGVNNPGGDDWDSVPGVIMLGIKALDSPGALKPVFDILKNFVRPVFTALVILEFVAWCVTEFAWAFGVRGGDRIAEGVVDGG